MVEASAVLGRSLGRDHHPNAFTTCADTPSKASSVDRPGTGLLLASC